MSAELLASATAGGTNGGTTPSVDTTGATVIVAEVAEIHGGPFPPNLTDSAGNTWSAIASSNVGSSPGVRSASYVCLNPNTSATHTFTVSDTGAKSSLCVAAFSTDDPNPTVDELSGNFASGTARPWQASSSQPGMVPTGPDELLIAFLAADNATGAWAPDGPLAICAQALGSSNQRASALAFGVTGVQPLNPSWLGTVPAAVIVGYVAIIG